MKSMLVFIGSYPLFYDNKLVKRPTDRKEHDVDFIAPYDEAVVYLRDYIKCHTIYPIANGKKLLGIVKPGMYRGKRDYYEGEIAYPDTTAESFLELVKYDVNHKDILIQGVAYGHAPLDVLYTLKMSHRYLRNSPHFMKTMRDIHLMRANGAKIPDKWKEWFIQREKETYNYSHPSLNKNKAEFFANDAIKYVYDHDSIHQAVNLFGTPAYKYFAVEDEEVLSSRIKFDTLPHDIRLAAVYEEAAVLALERSIVPHPGALSEKNAFLKALEKVCTSITSGWFREFSYESYVYAVQIYESQAKQGKSYVARFEKGLRNGIVKPHK